MEKTKLIDRTLWYDGESSYDINQLYHVLLKGKLSEFDINNLPKVSSSDTPVDQYNRLTSNNKILTKTKLNDVKYDWLIPDNYKTLNYRNYVFKKLKNEINENDFSADEIEERIERVTQELILWENYNFQSLLKTLIYIVEYMEEKSVVWGTGRGSSCCCYILYLIGLHEVDSVAFKLDLSEFFRE